MAKLNSKYLKPFKNIFLLIFIVFAIWMLFFDANSWFIHHELNSEIDKLEAEKEYYKKEIELGDPPTEAYSKKIGLPAQLQSI